MSTNWFKYSQPDDTIYGYYNAEVNINNLHDKITRILKYKQNNGLLSIFDECKEDMAYLVSNNGDEKSDLKNGLALFGNITKKLSYADNSLDSYSERSAPHIKEINKTKGDLKMALIALYLKLAKEYIKINVSRRDHSDDDTICSCGEKINNDDLDTCSKCGKISRCYLANSAFVDPKYNSDQSNKAKNRYDKFKDRHFRYQCRAGKVITSETLNLINEHIKSKKYEFDHAAKDRIKNLELLKKVLKACALISLLPDINLVAHSLWRYRIPDLRKLDDVIEDQWTKMQEALDTLKTDDDKSTMENNGWRQWRQYIQAGYDCDPREFDMPTSKVLIRSEYLWAQACKKLKWKLEVTLEV